jgi:hypothetical protein
MFALFLSACLANAPGVCRDFKVRIDSEGGPLSCMFQAPQMFGRWSAEHPGWTISRWRCGPATEDKI